MSAVAYCICPDGLTHGFVEGDDGIADKAFCGVKHEFVRSGDGDDKVCDVCFVESMAHLGVPRDDAVAHLLENDE